MDEKSRMRLIQQFEQAGKSIEPFANFVGVYFKNLINSGFNRDEALMLVKEFQFMIWSTAMSQASNQGGENTDSED
jgi:hypothetical protein